ncbi:helix-turn-helix domain-containing protein [Mycobacteroides abscessus]|uniref:helix-turn-helix domain-containing protein n=1 Tax=Mycobacteroides abscessus TaxID=36809 RepID=UPI000D8E5B11|nr:helix-turn-helix transcriptional regulator [Mycobacteroides abscessus]SPX87650.1 Uncharacterised protein [Mycobacteroides abscessus]
MGSKLEPTEAQRKAMAEYLAGEYQAPSEMFDRCLKAVDAILAVANSIPEGAPVGTIARRPDGAWIAERDSRYAETGGWNYRSGALWCQSQNALEYDADSWPVIFTPGEAMGSGPTTDGGETYDPREDEAPRLAEAASKPRRFYDAHGMRGSGVMVSGDPNQFTINASDPTAQQEPEEGPPCETRGWLRQEFDKAEKRSAEIPDRARPKVVRGTVEDALRPDDVELLETDPMEFVRRTQQEPERFPGIENQTTADHVGADNADEQLKLIFGLRDIRIERGLSVAFVGEALYLEDAEVERFECGSMNPTMSLIRRYARAVEAVFTVDVRKWEDTQLQQEPSVYELDRLAMESIRTTAAQQEPAYTVAAASEEMAKYWDNSIVTTTKREPRVVDRLGVGEQGSRWQDRQLGEWKFDGQAWRYLELTWTSVPGGEWVEAEPSKRYGPYVEALS